MPINSEASFLADLLRPFFAAPQVTRSLCQQIMLHTASWAEWIQSRPLRHTTNFASLIFQVVENELNKHAHTSLAFPLRFGGLARRGASESPGRTVCVSSRGCTGPILIGHVTRSCWKMHPARAPFAFSARWQLRLENKIGPYLFLMRAREWELGPLRGRAAGDGRIWGERIRPLLASIIQPKVFVCW